MGDGVWEISLRTCSAGNLEVTLLSLVLEGTLRLGRFTTNAFERGCNVL